MDPTAIDAIARQLIDAQDRATTIPPMTASAADFDVDAAYDVLLEIESRRIAQGWRPVGRKIGFTNRTIWPRYGVYQPIWGTVYDRTFIRAPAGRTRVPLAGLVNPRIEPEMCFGLRASPVRGRVLEAIEWMAHSIEIVQCHHADWKVTLADSTADNGLHGRLVVGAPQPLPSDLESLLPLAHVELRRGEDKVDEGIGANVLGSPLLALAHLVGVLEQSGARPLVAGEIVTTGTLTDAHPVKPGDTWSTRFTGIGLPGLTVEFT